MAKYLKRGILCLMAFLSLFVLFTSFYINLSDRGIFYEVDRIKRLYDDGWGVNVLIRIIHYGDITPRGVWFVNFGIRSLISDGIKFFMQIFVFETSFMAFLYLALFYLEFFGALAICGLAVMVLIKGDNGIFSKIIMFGSLAIIFLYAGQVFVWFWQPIRGEFLEKINRFFTDTYGWSRMSKLPIVLFALNAILCAGYFFISKRLPSEE